MPAYRFTTIGSDGAQSESLGATELRNDEEAVSFGRRIIEDLMEGDSAQYIGWVMVITEGDRAVRNIPFTGTNPTM